MIDRPPPSRPCRFPARDHARAVLTFPLVREGDALALSRFVDQVVDLDLCTEHTVIIEMHDRPMADRSVLTLLNVVVGRLARRHVRTVIIASRSVLLALVDHVLFPNIAQAHCVDSPVAAALFQLAHP